MPLYQYKCAQCANKVSTMSSAYENANILCDDCKVPMHKQVTYTSVHFKGSGFYETDYKGK